MDDWQRRAVHTIVGITVLILLSSVLYHWLLIGVEGRSPTYPQSLQTVIETYTGTGYGSDAGWDTTVLNVFVSAMDLSTFLLLFIVFPYIFQPVLAAALSTDVPRTTDASEHVLVCGYTARVESLVDELRVRGAEHVVVVDDEDVAETLVESGISVVRGDPTSVDALDRAGIRRAASVVVDISDAESASTVLACREADESVRVVVLVEDRSLERYLRYAGADSVLTPRSLLGTRIAERVKTEFSPYLSDSANLGDSFGLVELTIPEDSPLRGVRLEESEVWTDEDLTLVGVWTGGEFETDPSPHLEIAGHTSLLVAGHDAKLERLESKAYTTLDADGRVVIAGYGEVGEAVTAALESTDIDCTVVDTAPGEDIDVVGDATEEATLLEAGIEDAAVFVLTISDDDQAILSTLLARELVPEIDIIARVNDTANETKIRRAGAEYVLSLPDISGRLLAREVFREQVLSYDRQLKVVRVDLSRFAGETLGETGVLDAGGVVIGIERDGDVVTDVDASTTVREGDQLLLAGPDGELPGPGALGE